MKKTTTTETTTAANTNATPESSIIQPGVVDVTPEKPKPEKSNAREARKARRVAASGSRDVKAERLARKSKSVLEQFRSTVVSKLHALNEAGLMDTDAILLVDAIMKKSIPA